MSARDVQPQKRNGDQPHSQLEIYDKVVEGGSNEDVLDQLLLGLGNYDEGLMWQQVSEYQHALYAEAAFSRRLIKRAIEETKWTVAHDGWKFSDTLHTSTGNAVPIDVSYVGWVDLPPETRERLDKRRAVSAAADRYWDEMGEHRFGRTLRSEAVADVTDVGRDWTPPQSKMITMVHDSSRSLGARLMDNVFGRVERQEIKEERDTGGGALDRLRGGK